LLVFSCGEPQIIDNYECNSPHSVETIANQWAKTDFKEGEETLDIMAGELCDCFCQIEWSALTKENIQAKIDKNFVAYEKEKDPTIAAFVSMIACKNYLRTDRGGYQESRDWDAVIAKYKARCSGVESKRKQAQKKLMSKFKELNLEKTYFNFIID
jgi:hypothetical protein